MRIHEEIRSEFEDGVKPTPAEVRCLSYDALKARELALTKAQLAEWEWQQAFDNDFLTDKDAQSRFAPPLKMKARKSN